MTRHEDITLSKTLSWLLRHAAANEGLKLSSDGFIKVKEILKHQRLKHFTIEDVKRVVDTNSKQRFALRTYGGELEIRANQGHSMKDVGDLELIPITDSSKIGDVIHGTYLRNLNSIKSKGLSRMNRNHIHFAIGLPNDPLVISGIRHDAEIFIYIDVQNAINDGIEFFMSQNKVVLSPGNKDGFLEPKYFQTICRRDGSLV